MRILITAGIARYRYTWHTFDAIIYERSRLEPPMNRPGWTRVDYLRQDERGEQYHQGVVTRHANYINRVTQPNNPRAGLRLYHNKQSIQLYNRADALNFHANNPRTVDLERIGNDVCLTIDMKLYDIFTGDFNVAQMQREFMDDMQRISATKLQKGYRAEYLSGAENEVHAKQICKDEVTRHFVMNSTGVPITPLDPEGSANKIPYIYAGLKGENGKLPHTCVTMNTKKATGIDQIQPQFFKHPQMVVAPLISVAEHINCDINLFQHPQFKQSNVTMLSKSDSNVIKDGSDARPIQVLSVWRKNAEKAGLNILSILDYQSQGNQHGGYNMRSTYKPTVWAIKEMMNGKIIMFLDVKKAYDKIDRAATLAILYAKAKAHEVMMAKLQYPNIARYEFEEDTKDTLEYTYLHRRCAEANEKNVVRKMALRKQYREHPELTPIDQIDDIELLQRRIAELDRRQEEENDPGGDQGVQQHL